MSSSSRLWPLVVLAVTAGRASAGDLVVTAKDPEGLIVPGAEVAVIEADTRRTTGADGTAQFEGLAPGTYHVTVRLSGFTSARREVRLADNGPARVEIALSGAVHLSESVTVSPEPRDTFESYQPAAVIGGEELQQRLGATLGDTLATQVGVNARSFGPGPSRPVIRGLDGDRVLVLANGARTGDISSQSADHGVPIDPASAQQIEVVRGPATLLYGSNALGGVVNVITDAIPRQPARGWTGGFTGQAATANEEAAGAGSLGWGNERWALRAQGGARRTGDVKTPSGTVPNSESDLASGGFGLARTGGDGFVGASYSYDTTTYGIPLVEDGDTQLNPHRHHLDVRAERRNMGGLLGGVKLQLGYSDYRHDEKAGGVVATSFHNTLTEAQLLLNHRPVGRLKGTVGAWLTARSYTSEGEEALAPPTDQDALAGFVYEELSLGHVTLQAGARVDHSTFTPDGLSERRFTEMSASLGALVRLRENLTLAANAARAARHPSLEELYNHGPHAGNFAFEIGDPELDSEIGLGLDVSLRWRTARFHGEVTAFHNRIDNFIFPLQTGAVEDDLPVVQFVSRDSRIQGLEAHADIGLTRALWLELGADGVRGEIRTTNDPLPRMPPFRGWVGLRYERGGFHLEGELRGAAKQDRVYGAETDTDGYVLGNAHASYTFTTGRSAHTLTARVDNAGDTLYRNHLSFIKDAVPEVGRSLKLVYGVKF
jgi:iron complex outermembrane receptor protein